MTLNDYLDAAVKRLHEGSDRQLCAALGISASIVSHYRTGRAWPDDGTMIRLAELAGVDPAAALLDLNTWRAKSSAAKNVYSKIRAQLGLLAAILALYIGFIGSAGANGSGTDQPDLRQSVYYTIYPSAALPPSGPPRHHVPGGCAATPRSRYWRAQ